MQKIVVPRFTIWLIVVGVIFLTLMTLFRLVFFYEFKTADYSLSNTIDAFKLGLRFDLRIVSGLLILPLLTGGIELEYNSKGWLKLRSILPVMLLIGCIYIAFHFLTTSESPFFTLIILLKVFFAVLLIYIFFCSNCNPFESVFSGRVFKVYFLVVSFLIVFLFLVDFCHYSFLHERVNASILNYAANPIFSLKMVWETYPVIVLLLILFALTGLLYQLITYVYKRLKVRRYRETYIEKLFSGGFVALVLGVGIFGNLHIFPLKSKNALQWNDAFSFQNDFKAALSFNPVYSFISTLQYGNSSYDLVKVKAYYPLISSYLRVQKPDVNALQYNRFHVSSGNRSCPNIVLIICESFSAFKSSMWGNQLNTTPYFKQLCEEGVFFDRCFTPGYGTSQGVWATVTGIPDVELKGTASQNPGYVNQRSIINDFTNYSKFYFIGGASGWANLRGLFDNNINGIKIYDEGNLSAKIVNMWGISDKNLFLKADEIFKKQSKPFFAIIQTSMNHEPFGFDEDDLHEFIFKNYPKDTLRKYGFETNEELNAFRYTDYSFEKFIETAKNRAYYKNTLFVFVGDHGKGSLPPGMFPKAWELCKLGLTHVPLLFYAPNMLSPKRIHTVVSQLDVLPSVAALAGISYTNATLGQNVFDSLANTHFLKNPRFLFNSTLKTMGIVTDNHVYIKNFITDTEDFRSVNSDSPLSQTVDMQNTKEEMKHLTEAYFQTAKYMLSNNKKQIADSRRQK